MKLEDTRRLVPRFLQENFDRNLPIMVERTIALETATRLLFEGQTDQLPRAIQSAHDLCGSLGVMGLRELSTLAQEVEGILRAQDYGNASRQEIIRNNISNLKVSLQA